MPSQHEDHKRSSHEDIPGPDAKKTRNSYDLPSASVPAEQNHFQTSTSKRNYCDEIYRKLCAMFPNIDKEYMKTFCPANWIPGLNHEIQLNNIVDIIFLNERSWVIAENPNNSSLHTVQNYNLKQPSLSVDIEVGTDDSDEVKNEPVRTKQIHAEVPCLEVEHVQTPILENSLQPSTPGKGPHHSVYIDLCDDLLYVPTQDSKLKYHSQDNMQPISTKHQSLLPTVSSNSVMEKIDLVYDLHPPILIDLCDDLFVHVQGPRMTHTVAKHIDNVSQPSTSEQTMQPTGFHQLPLEKIYSASQTTDSMYAVNQLPTTSKLNQNNCEMPSQVSQPLPEIPQVKVEHIQSHMQPGTSKHSAPLPADTSNNMARTGNMHTVDQLLMTDESNQNSSQIHNQTNQLSHNEGREVKVEHTRNFMHPTLKSNYCKEIYHKLRVIFPGIDKKYIKRFCPANWSPGLSHDIQFSSIVEKILMHENSWVLAENSHKSSLHTFQNDNLKQPNLSVDIGVGTDDSEQVKIKNKPVHTKQIHPDVPSLEAEHVQTPILVNALQHPSTSGHNSHETAYIDLCNNLPSVPIRDIKIKHHSQDKMQPISPKRQSLQPTVSSNSVTENIDLCDVQEPRMTHTVVKHIDNMSQPSTSKQTMQPTGSPQLILEETEKNNSASQTTDSMYAVNQLPTNSKLNLNNCQMPSQVSQPLPEIPQVKVEHIQSHMQPGTSKHSEPLPADTSNNLARTGNMHTVDQLLMTDESNQNSSQIHNQTNQLSHNEGREVKVEHTQNLMRPTLKSNYCKEIYRKLRVIFPGIDKKYIKRFCPANWSPGLSHDIQFSGIVEKILMHENSWVLAENSHKSSLHTFQNDNLKQPNLSVDIGVGTDDSEQVKIKNKPVHTKQIHPDVPSLEAEHVQTPILVNALQHPSTSGHNSHETAYIDLCNNLPSVPIRDIKIKHHSQDKMQPISPKRQSLQPTVSSNSVTENIDLCDVQEPRMTHTVVKHIDNMSQPSTSKQTMQPTGSPQLILEETEKNNSASQTTDSMYAVNQLPTNSKLNLNNCQMPSQVSQPLPEIPQVKVEHIQSHMQPGTSKHSEPLPADTSNNLARTGNMHTVDQLLMTDESNQNSSQIHNQTNQLSHNEGREVKVEHTQNLMRPTLKSNYCKEIYRKLRVIFPGIDKKYIKRFCPANWSPGLSHDIQFSGIVEKILMHENSWVLAENSHKSSLHTFQNDNLKQPNLSVDIGVGTDDSEQVKIKNKPVHTKQIHPDVPSLEAEHVQTPILVNALQHPSTSGHNSHETAYIDLCNNLPSVPIRDIKIKHHSQDKMQPISPKRQSLQPTVSSNSVTENIDLCDVQEPRMTHTVVKHIDNMSQPSTSKQTMQPTGSPQLILEETEKKKNSASQTTDSMYAVNQLPSTSKLNRNNCQMPSQVSQPLPEIPQVKVEHIQSHMQPGTSKHSAPLPADTSNNLARTGNMHTVDQLLITGESNQTSFQIHNRLNQLSHNEDQEVKVEHTQNLMHPTLETNYCKEIYCKLRAIFPDIDSKYIKSFCPANWSPGVSHDIQFSSIVDKILMNENSWVLAENPNNSSLYGVQNDDVAIVPNVDDTYEQLAAIFPNADPHYLRRAAEGFRSENDSAEFITEKLQKHDYPTREQYLAKLRVTEEQQRYTKDFNVEHFLTLFPDPSKHFENEARKCTYNLIANEFLKNVFSRVRVNTINKAYRQCKYNVSVTAKLLRNCTDFINNSRRSREIPTEDIQLLQEMAFVRHYDKILQHIQTIKREEEEQFNLLKDQGGLYTCQCCFDEECMPLKTSTCGNGHIFCNSCIISGTDTKLADGETHVPCFIDCGSEFSITTFQKVLPPTKLCIFLKKRQAAEVAAAGLEGLVCCPFCDFASIPPEGDKVFKCFNPECMKESCIKCKEPNHVPYTCGDKRSERARQYIEEKMTEALTRTCYKCNKTFFKEEGCNKMTCTCGAQMCYICSQPVGGKDAYKHFRGQGSDEVGKCPLWTDNQVLNVETVRKVEEEARRVILRQDPTMNINTNVLAPAVQPPRPGPHVGLSDAHSLANVVAARVLGNNHFELK